MGTPFGGDRQRRRSRERPLSEFPGWGLDIMMGLYGPETVRAACERERPKRPTPGSTFDDLGPVPVESQHRWAPHHREPHGDDPGRPDDAHLHIAPLTPLTAQLAAADELVRFLERKFKRH